MSLAPAIRAACAAIAAEARHVRIVDECLEAFAHSLGRVPRHPPYTLELPGKTEARAALALTIDAVNFGSGWFPTLRKRDGLSGFHTISLGLRDHGPWTPQELIAISPAEVAAATGQEPDHELMALYATHLQELGRRARQAGGFTALARTPDLARELATWPTFADEPFFKRAQITAYDMVLAGLAEPGSEGELTIFADNLVPHVLRLDGVLEYDAALVAKIEAQEVLVHGSPEEVEIRVCALHAVERMIAARPELTAPGVDHLLWHRGQQARYKAVPRHRARCTAY